jgi:coenzyme F420-0:L-glutamate ligase/coenzyme F420-1:gamma-L-glutamate ligase
MSLNQIVKTRRSIRKYQPTSVSRKLVEEILVASGWAPSAHNSQCWRFIVLEDAALKRRLAEAMAKEWAADLEKDGKKVEPQAVMERVERFAQAPVLILACLTMEGLRRFPDAERQGFERDLAMQSLGAAMQTLLLTAHSTGLGACWFCAPGFCKDVVRGVLGIPDEAEPQSFVILGYPDESPKTPSKKAPSEFCFLDFWGNSLV